MKARIHPTGLPIEAFISPNAIRDTCLRLSVSYRGLTSKLRHLARLGLESFSPSGIFFSVDQQVMSLHSDVDVVSKATLLVS